MTLCVGLTGGIGCGKSTVADLFAEHGAAIIDTDVIAHRITLADGEAIPAISAAFGGEFIKVDGTLDRTRMRKLIFSDAAAKQVLESILHPLILKHAKAQLSATKDNGYIILVVPLLAESPAFQQLVQRVLVVDCDEATQISRVTGRNRISKTEVRAIIAQQTPRAKRLLLADDVIINDATLNKLAEEVAVLHERYANGL